MIVAKMQFTSLGPAGDTRPLPGAVSASIPAILDLPVGRILTSLVVFGTTVLAVARRH